MKKEKWRTIQLPNELVNEIEKYIKSDHAKRLGLHTVSGFVTYIVRKEIEKH